MSDQQHPEGPAAGDAGGPTGSAMSPEQAEVAAALEAAAVAPPPSADVAAGASTAVAAAAAGLSATAAAHVASLSAGAEAGAAGAGGAGAAGAVGGAGTGTAGTWTAVLFAAAAVVAVVGWFASNQLDAPDAAPTEPPLAAASPSDPTAPGTSAPSEVSPPSPGAGPALPAPSPDATAAPSPGPAEPPPDPDATLGEPPVGPVPPDDPAASPPDDPAASPPTAIAAPSPSPGTASEAVQPTSPASAPTSPTSMPSPAPTTPTANPTPTPEPTTTPDPTPGTVLRRVNAGGPTLSGHGGPNWQTDRPRTSPWRPESPDLSERHTHTGDVTVEPAVGDEVPADLFDTDRTHPGPISPWEWEFDVPDDEPVLVRIYLAERSSENGPRDRVFGLVVEDEPVDPALDLVSDPGRDVGTVREVVVPGGDLADGVLDVDFVRVTGDPVVSGIEVLSLDAAEATNPRRATPSGSTPGRGRRSGG